MTDLSVVVVEYRSLPELEGCLPSLERGLAPLSFETLVVSNSQYPPAEQQRAREAWPSVRWIFPRLNRGFAAGVNEGLSRARGRYVMLLNPDTRILDGRFKDIVEFMDREPSVGIVGPRLVGLDGRLEDSCREFLTPLRALRRSLRRIRGGAAAPVLEVGSDGPCRRADWVSGACMVVRRSAIEAVGPMDDRYFLYIEDMDWCRRFWDAGFKVMYWPSGTVEHRGRRWSAVGLFRSSHLKYTWMHAKSFVRYVLKHHLKVVR